MLHFPNAEIPIIFISIRGIMEEENSTKYNWIRI